MNGCVRCDQCCYHRIPGKKPIKCKFLVILKSGKTLCRIYNLKGRIGKITYKKDGYMSKCFEIKDSQYDYPHCPLNTDKEAAP